MRVAAVRMGRDESGEEGLTVEMRRTTRSMQIETGERMERMSSPMEERMLLVWEGGDGSMTTLGLLLVSFLSWLGFVLLAA